MNIRCKRKSCFSGWSSEYCKGSWLQNQGCRNNFRLFVFFFKLQHWLFHNALLFPKHVMWGQLWDKMCHSYSFPLHFFTACHHGHQGRKTILCSEYTQKVTYSEIKMFWSFFTGIQNNSWFFACFLLLEPSAAIWTGNVAWLLTWKYPCHLLHLDSM